MNLCKICNINPKYTSPSGQKSSYCSKCNSKKVSEYYKTDKGKETLRKSQDKYFNTENGKEKLRKAIRNSNRNKNGFSPELFDQRLSEQNYKCAICKKDIHESSHADHNHVTGAPRGILCPGCNTLLGRLESVGFDWVDNAKKYLQEY